MKNASNKIQGESVRRTVTKVGGIRIKKNGNLDINYLLLNVLH